MHFAIVFIIIHCPHLYYLLAYFVGKILTNVWHSLHLALGTWYLAQILTSCGSGGWWWWILFVSVGAFFLSGRGGPILFCGGAFFLLEVVVHLVSFYWWCILAERERLSWQCSPMQLDLPLILQLLIDALWQPD